MSSASEQTSHGPEITAGVTAIQWQVGTQEEMRLAIMFGRRLSGADGHSFYEYRGNIYVLSEAPLKVDGPTAMKLAGAAIAKAEGR